MDTKNLKVYSSRQDSKIEREMPEFLEHLDAIIAGKKDEESTTFEKTTKAYIKTTENINGYYDTLNFNYKKVLTVVGSGEQVFEAVLRGATKIDGFDISMNAIMLYYLKEAALKTDLIVYSAYMNLFYSNSESDDWFKLSYSYLRENLNPIAVPFWDKVFNSEHPKEIMARITEGDRYQNVSIAENKMAALSSHLSKRNFLELKSKIQNCEINIYLRDVKELDDLKGPYDYIILSNIFTYQKGPLQEKFKAAIERYRDMLTTSGKIIVGYAYGGVDLKDYPEYDQRKIPSRASAWCGTNNLMDTIMTTGRKR